LKLRAHTENVVVQSIGHELVLVNLENGVYYSMSDSGAVIFSLLDSGCDRDELFAKLTELFSSGCAEFKEQVAQFVDQLLAESLLVPGVGTCALDAGEFVGEKFAAPRLDKYEDLQELLLLDPVRGQPTPVARTSESG